VCVLPHPISNSIQSHVGQDLLAETLAPHPILHGIGSTQVWQLLVAHLLLHALAGDHWAQAAHGVIVHIQRTGALQQQHAAEQAQTRLVITVRCGAATAIVRAVTVAGPLAGKALLGMALRTPGWRCECHPNHPLAQTLSKPCLHKTNPALNPGCKRLRPLAKTQPRKPGKGGLR
jgi:hypothetical protein